VCIVDDRQNRLLFGGRGKQAQGRREHCEGIGRLRRPDRQSAGESGRLRLGDIADQLEDGMKEFRESREGQLGLGLDAGRREHGHALGLVRGVPKEGALADPGLSTDDQSAADPAPGAIQQGVETRLLISPAQEHKAMVVSPSSTSNRRLLSSQAAKINLVNNSGATEDVISHKTRQSEGRY
jgi:hypothetical protein